ncbi:MAG: hypothetical protein IT416_03185 [Candidatus Pacebacteria bacterium]|nr:hypothetical protein [Candidatus Paceibacterota bacterium]
MIDNTSREKFRVFLAEDNQDWITELSKMIDEIGGVLVKTATTLESAIEIMSKVEELKIDLIILGGSLDESYQPGGPDSLAILILLLREQIKNPSLNKIKTIAFSGDVQSRLGEYVDKDIPKWRYQDLAPAILALMAGEEV